MFAGDSAHGVSPFGARGANSGVQDAENLAWKLDTVLKGEVNGRAAEALLDSYGSEREYAADENLLNSTRATDFITPKSEISKQFRNATLDLATEFPFARQLVNSGRLSVPATLYASPLNTPDTGTFDSLIRPGAPAMDAPITHAGEAGWLLRQLSQDFTLVVYADTLPAELAQTDVDKVLVVTGATTAQDAPGLRVLRDHDGLFARRYDARPGSAWLMRPDLHVCARWRNPRATQVLAARQRAVGNFIKD
jgi:3-(3-hydroxy-phenyl)propionate hydroxylase